MKSMTGFGTGTATGNGINVEVEMGSVNRKQLDIRLSIPRNLSALEPKIREIIQTKITRGNINVLVKITNNGLSDDMAISVNKKMVEEYLKELRKTASEFELQDDLRASVLLRLPDIIQSKAATDDIMKVWTVIKRALSPALAELIEMRKVEGAALAIDIEKRFKKLKTRYMRLAKIAPTVSKQYGKRLQQRLDEAGIADDKLAETVARELIVFVDKADISEELVRLDSHLKQVDGLLKASKPIGRTLDFLCQEMFREINTIGSKGNDVRISKEVVEFKAELETVREQVQNIE